jgi:GntR family transcriptional regulator
MAARVSAKGVRDDFPAVPLIHGPAPLYRQLSQVLRDAIATDRLSKGTLFPSEHELAERFRVSRITVRHALQGLEAEGLIRRRRAKGTVVLGMPLSGRTGWVVDTLQDVLAFGQRTRVKMKSFRKEAASPDVAALLGVRPGEPVPCVRGLRILDGAALGAFSIYLTPTVGERLTVRDVRQPTIFSAIQNRLGIPLVEARQIVWAERADRALARTLGIRAGDPTLCIQRIYLTADEVPVEVATTRYRADRYRLEHSLKRLAGDAADRREPT